MKFPSSAVKAPFIGLPLKSGDTSEMMEHDALPQQYAFLAFTNSLFDESAALSMLLIKPFTVYHNATILNTVEIIYSALG